jgi:cysteinyl-tRNA synthetase
LGASGSSSEIKAALEKQMEATQQVFVEAMDDDFNSSGGLAALFELVRVINTSRDDGATDAELKTAQDTLQKLSGVFGLRLTEKKRPGSQADKFISLLVEIRSEMRKQGNWVMSDLIRDRLKELEVVVEDSKGITTWHW